MSRDSLPPLESFSEENRQLVEALRSENQEIRLATLEEVSDTVDDEIAAELLRTIEEDPDESFRARAAIALGPALESCNEELDENGQLPDPNDPLSLSDLSLEVYQDVLGRLRAIHDDEGAPTEVRRRALESSVRSPQQWHEEAIRKGWASSDEDWRLTAVFCMGFCCRSDFSREIEKSLGSSSTDIVLEGILAAGRRSLEKLCGRIARIANDRRNDTVLRLAAIESLAAFEEGEKPLADLMNDIDPEIAEAAGEALTDRQAMSGLEELDDLESLEDLADLASWEGEGEPS